MLEFRRLIREGKRGQEVTLIQRHRLEETALTSQPAEVRRVTPQDVLVDRDLVGRPHDEQILSGLAPEVVQGLAKRTPRGLRIRIRPEERQQRLSPHETAGALGRHVGKHRQPLRLSQDRADLCARNVREHRAPERGQPKHCCQSATRSKKLPGDGQVTRVRTGK